MVERVEIALVAVVPPMELEEVETLYTHTPTRDVDCLFDDASRHPAGMRHPFGESLDFRQPLGPVKGSETAAEVADEGLGRAVMIGEIPGREPGVVVGEHLVDRPHRVDRAMRTGDLPHPVED